MDYIEFENILDASLDGIHITDKNGITLFYNKACEKIEGISRETMIGKDMNTMVECGIYSSSVALDVIAIKKPIKSLQNVNNRQILAHGIPIFKNKKLDKVVITSRDITHIEELKSEFLDLKNEIDTKSKKQTTKEENKTKEIVYKSEVMNKTFDLAKRVARVDSTVLVLGQSGVGKGVISKFIHDNSFRKNESFIKIDCGSIPETLIESELFGYEKGSFTGANKDGSIGLVELANNGTLFLDEIGELSLHVQSKLLTLIQDKQFYKIGGKKKISVNIRIIAATNKDLYKMVREKKFRKDLFYRLNVVPIEIAELRDRREDISLIANMFLDKFNKKYNLSKSLSNECMEILTNYSWPGNVRELENIIERLVIVSEGNIIDKIDIPYEIIREENNTIDLPIGNVFSLNDAVNYYEKEILINTKKYCNNTLEMSRKLKVDRSTIRRKLNKHNIDFDFK